MELIHFQQRAHFLKMASSSFSTLSSTSSAITASSSSLSEEELTLTVKWSGKEYTVRVCGDDSVAELKRRICELTNVLPKRQKLLYPKIGNKLSDDSILLSQLPLKSSLKMTMMGFVSLTYFICVCLWVYLFSSCLFGWFLASNMRILIMGLYFYCIVLSIG